MSDLERITKRWYTEQRGRRLGNTKMWAELSEDERNILMASVQVVLEDFLEFSQPEPTPHEARQAHG